MPEEDEPDMLLADVSPTHVQGQLRSLVKATTAHLSVRSSLCTGLGCDLRCNGLSRPYCNKKAMGEI